MTNKQRAELYRKAAELVENPPQYSCQWACNAIEHAVYGRLYRDTEGRVVYGDDAILFHRFFEPDDFVDDLQGFFGDARDAGAKEDRLTALCFMAAMVEAGDA